MGLNEQQKITRRQFIGQVAAGAVGLAGMPLVADAASARRSAVDSVVLGRSRVSVSRLGLGIGTNGGQVQRGMGQQAFTRMIRHAIDRGITFFDSADNYEGMHEMLREALKGVDRSKLQIQSKIPYGKYEDPIREIERFCREVGTDHFDTFLIHHVRTADWQTITAKEQDKLEEAKQRGLIRAHGVSIHGLVPLRAATQVGNWLDLAQVRVNHNGTHMDGPTGAWNEQGDVHEAVANIKKIHDNGAGIVGMKLIGNGNFQDPNVREQSIRYVMGLDFVDAVVIGFKSPEEIDEAITRMNNALNA